MRIIHIVTPVLALSLLSGCALNKITADRTAAMLTEASAAFNEEADLTFAREAMPANIKMMEGLAKASPENTTLLTMLAQSYCSYAFAFLEDSDVSGDFDRARALYRRGYEFGLRSLPDSVRRYANGDLEQFEKAVSTIGASESANMFWAAYCLGNWVNATKSDVAAVAELPRAEILMHQVLNKDPEFYYGSVHIFYGAYYGGRPKMLGGDPKQAREHLEKAIKLTGGKFLMPKYFMARFVAVPTQDEELFDRTLREIAETPASSFSAERLANEVAKKRALKLASNKKDLF